MLGEGTRFIIIVIICRKQTWDIQLEELQVQFGILDYRLNGGCDQVIA